MDGTGPVDAGSLTLPAPTMQGVYPLNVRDVGGLPTAAGGAVRRGILYRGETPPSGAAPPGGIEHWPPRTVIDLRVNIDGPHPLAEVGATVHTMPMAPWLDPEEMARSESHKDDLPARYLRMVRNAEPEVSRLFEIVATAEPPILVHCIIGKDRTGIIIALLLRTLGVDRAAVLEDYERTNDSLPQLLAGFRASGQRLPSDQSLLEVSPQALHGALDSIEGDSGSPVEWLLRHSVDPGNIDRLRKRLTTG